MEHTLASNTLKNVLTGMYDISLNDLNKYLNTHFAFIAADSAILYIERLLMKWTPM